MDESDARELGERVAAARLGRKLSKEGAARLAGVSTITYKRIEDGKSVRDTSLAQVLDALGLSETVTPDLHDEPLNTRKPEWMSDEQWRLILRENADHFQFLLDKAAREH